MKYWIYGDHEKDVNVLDVKTPQADLTDLFPFCDYETQVCAYNLMGDGPDTDVVECKTLEDGNLSKLWCRLNCACRMFTALQFVRRNLSVCPLSGVESHSSVSLQCPVSLVVWPSTSSVQPSLRSAGGSLQSPTATSQLTSSSTRPSMMK